MNMARPYSYETVFSDTYASLPGRAIQPSGYRPTSLYTKYQPDLEKVMTDPLIHIHKTVLMQRLLDAVVRGHYWHTGGTIPLEKAARLAEKFTAHYGTTLNVNQRAYRKAKGMANAKLFFLAQRGSRDLSWWLVATSGVGCIHEMESLNDARARSSRIRVDEDYELLPVTRSKQRGGGTCWTWRMTRIRYGEWAETLLAACRKVSNRQATQLLGSLNRSPGFGGIRQQVYSLATAMKREWRRRHGSMSDFPEVAKLSYVERLSDTAVPLSELLKLNPS